MTTPPNIARMVAYDGLSRVAHAVRRSTALWAAVMTSPEGTAEDAMLSKADRYARWILGHADEGAQQQDFLGSNPWSQT